MRVGISGFQPERLTQIREARGLSKINLGRLVERSPSTITKWENGSHSPDAEVLHELSKILNCPVTWFTKVYSPQPEKNKKPVFLEHCRVQQRTYVKRLKSIWNGYRNYHHTFKSMLITQT